MGELETVSPDRHVRGFASVERVAQRRLARRDGAATLGFLRAPLGNLLDAPGDGRTGSHKMRIEDRWRLSSGFADGCAYDAEIVDEYQARAGEASATTRLDPIHPREVPERVFLGAVGLSATVPAKATGMTPARISEIVGGRRGITPALALRSTLYFGTGARSPMNLLQCYDPEHAARAMARRCARLSAPRGGPSERGCSSPTLRCVGTGSDTSYGAFPLRPVRTRRARATGSNTWSTTRSFSGMIALSVIVMCSGQTFVQHFVMLQ